MKTSGLADSPLFIERPQPEEKATSNQEHSPSGLKACHPDDMVATIAKSMHEVGKEGCTYRLTQREKTALIEIIYHFRMRNCRLSENEIARIAINFLIEDFKAKKNDCLIRRIIDIMQS